jgi:hypothetical protein
MTAPQRQRSVPEILEDIASNLTQIVQAEFLLAKSELKEGAKKSQGQAPSWVQVWPWRFTDWRFCFLPLCTRCRWSWQVGSRR